MSEQVVAGRYRLVRRLGTGGMSEVWLAEDVELERQVALKLLGAEADAARFEREARAAAALAHPNVNQLFDYGEWQGRPYMVLECLSGGTLEDRLRGGQALPDDETARIAAELAAGLAHAHDRGLVHRDLKPANVLFDEDGRAKIADFGIARMRGAGTLTEAGTLLGTAAYISPEQAAGAPATAASDVYSYGVILFRMLTGRLPFESEVPLELVAQHRDKPPPPVASIRPDAPSDLARLADASLAKDPAARPRDGRALTAALAGIPKTAAEAATVVLPPTAPPTTRTRIAAPPPRPPGRRARIRRDRLALLLLGLLAAAGAGLAAALIGSGSSSPPVTHTSTRHRTTHTTRTTSTQTSTPTSRPTSTTSTSTHTTTTQPTTTRPTTTRPTTARTSTSPPPPTTAPTSTPLPTSSGTTTVSVPIP